VPAVQTRWPKGGSADDADHGQSHRASLRSPDGDQPGPLSLMTQPPPPSMPACSATCSELSRFRVSRTSSQSTARPSEPVPFPVMTCTTFPADMRQCRCVKLWRDRRASDAVRPWRSRVATGISLRSLAIPVSGGFGWGASGFCRLRRLLTLWTAGDARTFRHDRCLEGWPTRWIGLSSHV